MPCTLATNPCLPVSPFSHQFSLKELSSQESQFQFSFSVNKQIRTEVVALPLEYISIVKRFEAQASSIPEREREGEMGSIEEEKLVQMVHDFIELESSEPIFSVLTNSRPLNDQTKYLTTLQVCP